jgi:hypothetical protein
MPSAAARSEGGGWLAPAIAVVAVVTGLRLVALAFNRTDLFVDEAQYWFWGQNFDFGYYSKPPLIGWLLRAVTDLAGSDAPFWVRMPGAVLHGVTGLILAALAARLADGKVALWTAAIYVTLPFVSLGSLLISTDTVMAPFYAGALLFFVRAGQDGRAGDAFVAGVCAGGAFMAKYAAVYLIPGAMLAVLVAPALRPGWRNAALMAVGFGLVIAPNVIWNLSHDLTTVEHTMDNVGWVRTGANFRFGGMVEFMAAQFVVFGPLTMVALLWGIARARTPGLRALAVLALPPLVVVLVQSALGKAYANWAVATYFAGTVLAVWVMGRRWRWLALGVNLLAAVALPLLTILAPWPAVKGQALLHRYLGRTTMSQQILALARADGLPVVSTSRDVLADLFYTGRESGVPIYAVRPNGRPAHYYAQNFALPTGFTGKVLLIATAPIDCGAGPVPPAGVLTGTGTWAGKGLTPYVIDAECLDAAD